MASDPFRSIVLKLTNLACRMKMHATTGNGIQILDDRPVAVAGLLAADVHLLQGLGDLADDRNPDPFAVGLPVEREHVPPVVGPEEEALALVVVQRLGLGLGGRGPVGPDLLQRRIGVVDPEAQGRPGIGYLVVADLHLPGTDVDPPRILVPEHVNRVVEAVHHVPGPVVSEEAPVVLHPVNRIDQQVDMFDLRREITRRQRVGITQFQPVAAAGGRCRDGTHRRGETYFSE